MAQPARSASKPLSTATVDSEAVVTREQRVRHDRARQARHAFLTTSQSIRDAEQALQRSPPLPPLLHTSTSSAAVNITTVSLPCVHEEDNSENSKDARLVTPHRRVRSAVRSKTGGTTPRLNRKETGDDAHGVANTAAHNIATSAEQGRGSSSTHISQGVQREEKVRSTQSSSPLPRQPLATTSTRKKKKKKVEVDTTNEEYKCSSAQHQRGLMARVQGWLSRREGEEVVHSPSQSARSRIASPLPYSATQADNSPGLGYDTSDTLLILHPDEDASPRMPLSLIAWIYCALNIIASLLMLIVITLIAAHEWHMTRTGLVHDGGACEGVDFVDRIRPDLTFTLLCFAINGIAAVWFALQGAYYEKAGSLVGQLVTVALQLGRVLYFIFYVAQRYCDAWALMGLVRVLLLVSASAWVVSACLSWWVWRGFGWRPYIEGIAESSALARRRRYLAVQTCLQLDAVVTLNAYLTMLFLFDSQTAQLFALGVTGLVLLVLATLLPLLRRTRHWAPLLVALLILILSMSLYTFVILSQSRWSEGQERQRGDGHRRHGSYTLQREERFRHVTRPTRVADVDDGMCYAKQLQGCLRRDHVYIVLSSLTANDTVMQDVTYVMRRENVGWVNGTSTYLPTKGLHGEYFELRECNASCFETQGSTYLRHITACCASYGRCRLKDGFRVYSVALLASLAAVALLVRLVLAHNAWSRYVEGDDAAAEEEATRLARRLF